MPFTRRCDSHWDATASGLVFNFLSSPDLAAAPYLHWRNPADVVAFARSLAGQNVRMLHDYLEGDYTGWDDEASSRSSRRVCCKHVAEAHPTGHPATDLSPMM